MNASLTTSYAPRRSALNASLITSYAPRGSVLRVYRVSRDLSQRELGRLADVRQETISRLECGHHSPSRKTANAIAHVLRVDRSALFPPEEAPDE